MKKNQQCSLWNGGVGLMVSKTAASTLACRSKGMEWQILVANFSGSPAITITVHYSPIEGNLEAEDHYYHLTAAVREIIVKL